MQVIENIQVIDQKIQVIDLKKKCKFIDDKNASLRPKMLIIVQNNTNHWQKNSVIDKKNANSSTTKLQAFNQKYKLSARIIQIIDKKI